MLQFLDYISSYVLVAGIIWYIFLVGIKFIPIILNWNKEKVDRWQIRTLLISFPLSLVFGLIIFKYFDLYTYIKAI